MNGRTLAAGVACGLAAIWVAWLAMAPGRAGMPSAQAVVPVVVAMPEGGLAMVERPLFSPTRRPLVQVVAAERPPATLLATMVGPGRGAAVLRLADGVTQVAQTGEQVAGWTLREVRSGSVTMGSQGRTLTLLLEPKQ